MVTGYAGTDTAVDMNGIELEFYSKYYYRWFCGGLNYLSIVFRMSVIVERNVYMLSCFNTVRESS